jgi:hypothetical protein
MKDNIAFYINLISDLIDEKICPSSFERVFPYVFNRDQKLDKQEYVVLNKLFYAVEDYVSDPEIRDESDLNEEDLLRVAKETLQELNKESFTT